MLRKHGKALAHCRHCMLRKQSQQSAYAPPRTESARANESDHLREIMPTHSLAVSRHGGALFSPMGSAPMPAVEFCAPARAGGLSGG